MDSKKSWFGKLFQADTPGNFSIIPEDDENDENVRIEPRDPVAYPNAANLRKEPETQEVFNRIKLKQEFAPPVRPARPVQDLPERLLTPSGPPRPFGERRPQPEPVLRPEPRPEPRPETRQAEPIDAVASAPAVEAPIPASPVVPRERPPRPLSFHELAGGHAARLSWSPESRPGEPASGSLWPPRQPAYVPFGPKPPAFNPQASRSDRPIAAARPVPLPDPYSDPEPSPRAYRLEQNPRGGSPEATVALSAAAQASANPPGVPGVPEPVPAGTSFPPDHAARAMQTNGRNWGRRSTDRLGPDGLPVVTEANRRWQLLSQFEPDLSDPSPAPRRRATDRPRSGEEV